MAARQNALAKTLIEKGAIVHSPIIESKDFFYESPYHLTILEVYKTLGGILNEYPVNFGSFDIVLDQCLIELDEENHFNRYRKLTLHSPIYTDYKYFPVFSFISFCDAYEYKVRDYGQFWTSSGSVKQFGQSSAPGDFSEYGSSRWKQRAFYDYLKDIYCLLQEKPVYRFSIYETIGNVSLNKLLNTRIENENIYQFINERIPGIIKNQ